MADERTQMRKGVMDLAVMALLRDRESYGGEVVDALATLPGLDAGAGTIYPVLARLRTAGLVDTTWQESPVGPPRKYYRLTDAGRSTLSDLTATWRQLSDAMATLLESR